jgi:hypothetical protein
VDLAGNTEAKMGRKALFGLSLRLSCGSLWDFSDSLSTLDFSHSRRVANRVG